MCSLSTQICKAYFCIPSKLLINKIMVTQSPVRFPDSLQESFSLTIFMYSVNSKSFYMQKKIIQKNQSDLQRKKRPLNQLYSDTSVIYTKYIICTPRLFLFIITYLNTYVSYYRDDFPLCLSEQLHYFT